MPIYETTFEINAPVNRVWAVLTDFEQQVKKQKRAEQRKQDKAWIPGPRRGAAIVRQGES
jgi:hypothetical protein